MSDKDQAFLENLLALFQVESTERLQRISSLLLKLEKNEEAKDSQSTIEEIFRETHSLKGAAGAVHNTEVEKICQSLEDIFESLRKNSRDLTLELFDYLHKMINQIEKKVKSNGENEKILEFKYEEEGRFSYLISETSKTIRISTEKLNAILLEVEEMRSASARDCQRVEDILDIQKMLLASSKNKSASIPEYQNLIKNLNIKTQGVLSGARQNGILTQRTYLPNERDFYSISFTS